MFQLPLNKTFVPFWKRGLLFKIFDISASSSRLGVSNGPDDKFPAGFSNLLFVTLKPPLSEYLQPFNPKYGSPFSFFYVSDVYCIWRWLLINCRCQGADDKSSSAAVTKVIYVNILLCSMLQFWDTVCWGWGKCFPINCWWLFNSNNLFWTTTKINNCLRPQLVSLVSLETGLSEPTLRFSLVFVLS